MGRLKPSHLQLWQCIKKTPNQTSATTTQEQTLWRQLRRSGAKNVASRCRLLKCLSILTTIWLKNCKQSCAEKRTTKDAKMSKLRLQRQVTSVKVILPPSLAQAPVHKRR